MNWYTLQGVPMYISTTAATLMENAGVHPQAIKSNTGLFTPKAPTFTDQQVSSWLASERLKADKAKIKKMSPSIRALAEMV
jgi:hypothetical protein